VVGRNSATILLHEAFTDRYDRSSTSSLNRSLASAKCIVNAMTILYHSSYDLGGIDPSVVSILFHAVMRTPPRNSSTDRHARAAASSPGAGP
jgi:hypothetical protein